MPENNNAQSKMILTKYKNINNNNAEIKTNAIAGDNYFPAIELTYENLIKIIQENINYYGSGLYIPLTQKGANNGVSPLDSSGYVPLVNINPVLVGAINYKGTFQPSLGSYPIIPAPINKGFYYIASDEGIVSGIFYRIGDIAVSNGVIFERLDGSPDYNLNSFIYVDSNVSVSGNGTLDYPLKTIQEAINISNSGDTIIIVYNSASAYIEDLIINISDLTFIALNGNNTFTPTNLIGNKSNIYVEIQGNILIQANNLIFKNIKVNNSLGIAIEIDNKISIQLTNCYIDGEIRLKSNISQCSLFINNSYTKVINGNLGINNNITIQESFIDNLIAGNIQELNIFNSTINFDISANLTLTNNINVKNSKINGNITGFANNYIYYSEILNNITIADNGILIIKWSLITGNIILNDNNLISIYFTFISGNLSGNNNIAFTGINSGIQGSININSGNFSYYCLLYDDTIFNIGTSTIIKLLKAIDIFYDNTTSGLTSTDVQGAIDEILLSGSSLSYLIDVINKINNAINNQADVTLTTTGAGDLQTAINNLINGQILEIKTNAFYNSVIIPAGLQDIVIKVAKGYNAGFNGVANAVTLKNNINNLIFIGFKFINCTTPFANQLGSAICLEHQAVINNCIFYQNSFVNCTGSAVMLSYHQTIGGDLYFNPNIFPIEFSNKISFVENQFYNACNETIEGANLTVRGIYNLFLFKNKVIVKPKGFRGFNVQNCIDFYIFKNEILMEYPAIPNQEGIKIDRLGTATYMNIGYIGYNIVNGATEGIDIDDYCEVIAFKNKINNCSISGIQIDNNSIATLIDNLITECNKGIEFELGSITAGMTNNICYANNINYSMLNLYVPDSSNINNLFNTSKKALEIPFDDSIANLGAYNVQKAIENINSVFSNTGEPMGFENRTSSAISFTDLSRDFQIDYNSDTIIYNNGHKIIKSAGTFEKITLPNITGLYFIYFNSSGILTASTSVWNFSTDVFIATVYYDSTLFKGLIGDERHGIIMDYNTHHYLHITVGTRFESGLTGLFTNVNLISVSSGKYWDEDIQYSILAQNNCKVLYRNPTVTGFLWTNTQSPYIITNLGILQYDNAGTLTNVPNGSYMAYWIFASNDINNYIYVITGQRIDANLTNARNNNTYANLNLPNLPFQEFKLLYRVIVRNNAGTPQYTETQDLRTISNLPATTYIATVHASLSGRNDPNQHDGSAITYYNTVSYLKSTDVQSAIDEIVGLLITITDNDYTILDNDNVKTILMSTGAIDRTVFLPIASNNIYRIINIKKIDSGIGKVTIDGNGTETIDNALTKDLISQYDHLTIQSDGNNWWII